MSYDEALRLADRIIVLWLVDHPWMKEGGDDALENLADRIAREFSETEEP